MNSAICQDLTSPSSNAKAYLLIDDDPVMEKLAYCYLRQAHSGGSFDLQRAACLASALKVLKSRKFDHVLLDNRLPPFPDISETIPKLEPYLDEAILTVISAAIDDPSFFGPKPARVDTIVDKSDFKAWIMRSSSIHHDLADA